MDFFFWCDLFFLLTTFNKLSCKDRMTKQILSNFDKSEKSESTRIKKSIILSAINHNNFSRESSLIFKAIEASDLSDNYKPPCHGRDPLVYMNFTSFQEYRCIRTNHKQSMFSDCNIALSSTGKYCDSNKFPVCLQPAINSFWIFNTIKICILDLDLIDSKQIAQSFIKKFSADNKLCKKFPGMCTRKLIK